MNYTPFQLISTLLFGVAVLHVFFSDIFQKKAKQTEEKLHVFYAFFGNTTLIFGIWLVPTLILMVLFEGTDSLKNTLEMILKYLKENAEVQMKITGHTESSS